MRALILAGIVVGAVSAMSSCSSGEEDIGSGVEIDADDIGGVVTSAQGPEAGVWVVAETTDLPTRFIRIVATDDQGRYVLPDLPAATYDVFVRGYGLVDSPRVSASPGQMLDLEGVVAPDARAAAEVYPAAWWLSMIELPEGELSQQQPSQVASTAISSETRRRGRSLTASPARARPVSRRGTIVCGSDRWPPQWVVCISGLRTNVSYSRIGRTASPTARLPRRRHPDPQGSSAISSYLFGTGERSLTVEPTVRRQTFVTRRSTPTDSSTASSSPVTSWRCSTPSSTGPARSRFPRAHRKFRPTRRHRRIGETRTSGPARPTHAA